MPHYITDNSADGVLNTDLQNFSSVCSANVATLGLSPTDLTEITAAATGFNTKLNAWTAERASADNAKAVKNTQRTTSRNVVSKWAKTFRANATIPDGLLNQLLLAPHKTTGMKTPPTQPFDLVANSDGNGYITLRWNRNGNIQGTQFIIEYRASAAGNWSVLSTTTRATFQTSWNPGSYVAYRVIAKRNDQVSDGSTPVVLWDGGSSVEFVLAA